jgi:hypothetical protein
MISTQTGEFWWDTQSKQNYKNNSKIYTLTPIVIHIKTLYIGNN